MELCIQIWAASVFQNSILLFPKHSNNIGLMENSDIFFPLFFFSYFLICMFSKPCFSFRSSVLILTYFTKQTMQASHMSILLKHLLVL